MPDTARGHRGQGRRRDGHQRGPDADAGQREGRGQRHVGRARAQAGRRRQQAAAEQHAAAEDRPAQAGRGPAPGPTTSNSWREGSAKPPIGYNRRDGSPKGSVRRDLTRERSNSWCRRIGSTHRLHFYRRGCGSVQEDVDTGLVGGVYHSLQLLGGSVPRGGAK